MRRHPREAGIQYSAAVQFDLGGSGILDRPVKPGEDNSQGCRITLPIALRPASTFKASAVCASGKVRSTCDEILPSAVHFTSFSRLTRFLAGVSRAQLPQNTPRMSH